MEKSFIGDSTKDDLQGKNVLLRVDFNIKFLSEENYELLSDRKIKASLETIEFLIQSNAKTVICTHIGRPKGKFQERLSTKHLIPTLEFLLNKKSIKFCSDSIGEDAQKCISDLDEGDVLLLENLRFHSEELNAEDSFAQDLAHSIDIFVNDAFSLSHGESSSITKVPSHVLHSCYGFLVKKELEALGSILETPSRPLVAVIGGSKVSSKLGILHRLIGKVDKLILGGAMVYTFYKAMGYSVGDSLVEEDFISLADEMMKKAEESKVPLVLTTDSVIVPTEQLQKGKVIDLDQLRIVSNETIPDGWTGVDIGDISISNLEEELMNCKTILWNGPMGVCEAPEFSKGSKFLMNHLSELTKSGVKTIVCGGSTISFIETNDFLDAFSYSSTGGGASLYFLEGKPLPGLDVLSSSSSVLSSKEVIKVTQEEEEEKEEELKEASDKDKTEQSSGDLTEKEKEKQKEEERIQLEKSQTQEA